MNNGNTFNVNVVVMSVSGFHFGLKFGRHSFSVNSIISKMFFPSTSCIFVSMIAASIYGGPEGTSLLNTNTAISG